MRRLGEGLAIVSLIGLPGTAVPVSGVDAQLQNELVSDAEPPFILWLVTVHP